MTLIESYSNRVLPRFINDIADMARAILAIIEVNISFAGT